MTLTKPQIEIIKQRFNEIETRRNFLDLINYINKLLHPKNYKPIELKTLTYYSISKHRDKCYQRFSIKKKSGKKREICSPNNELKNIQRIISIILQSVYIPNNSAKGFLLDTSVADNAKVHLNQNYVYNIDLKDFFSSIEQARVWACLKLQPFNLNDNNSIKDKLNIENGIKLLETEQGEKIFYSIDTRLLNIKNFEKSDFVRFIPDLEDDKEKFCDRIKQRNNLIIEKFRDGNVIDFDLVFKNGYKFSTEALADLVFSEPNIGKLKKLQISRLLINNIISNISCTIMEVERKDESDNIITVEKSILPQGAPTSPILSNIVCGRLDFLLNGLAKRFNLQYTRYADDITFSSMHNVYKKNGKFIQELKRIIMDQCFEIKASKTRLQHKAYRQEVTGIVVNDKLNVRKRYIKELRMWLYYWDKYGYEKAESLFRKDYLKDKGHVKSSKAKLENVLFGKLEYLKMIKGSNDSTYLTLDKKFEKLKGKSNSINKLLDLWEKQGIETAINQYEKDGLVYSDLKTYLKQNKINHVLYDKNRVKFKNDLDEVIDTIIVSKNARQLITETLLIEFINNSSKAKNWYIFHDKYKDIKILFTKNRTVPKVE